MAAYLVARRTDRPTDRPTTYWGANICVAYLPQFLQFVDLLGRDLASSELLLLRGHFDEPRQELTVLDERLPLTRVPTTREMAVLCVCVGMMCAMCSFFVHICIKQ